MAKIIFNYDDAVSAEEWGWCVPHAFTVLIERAPLPLSGLTAAAKSDFQFAHEIVVRKKVEEAPTLLGQRETAHHLSSRRTSPRVLSTLSSRCSFVSNTPLLLEFTE